jgi:hypothetical protein
VNFKIGQKIVCVNDLPGINDGRIFLKIDCIYTVSDTNGKGGLQLKEEDPNSLPRIDVNGNIHYYPFWHEARFKPLSDISDKLSEEILNEVLTTIKEPELV